MTCCILGHREIFETEELRSQVYQVMEILITREKVDTFLFGSKSQFNGLCYELVSELKEKYPCLKRIYVCAEFPAIGEDYRKYLLAGYEDTYYPESLVGAGRLVYIKRNQEMINKSYFGLFYYDDTYRLPGGKSGTKIAMDYAERHKKTVFVFLF